ncbi:MAG: LamG domain-containing protein [Actinomycetota bacterium]
MRSYKDDLEEARRALQPPENAYERLLKRRDRTRRKNQIVAGVLGLVIASGGLLAVVSAFTQGRDAAEPGPQCAPNPADLTHWWPGNGTGADLVGAIPATLHGDATFGPGLVGQAFMLDGVGDFVSVPDDSTLDFGTGDFTIALWVKFHDTEDEQILVEKWVQASSEPEIVQGWTFTKLPDNHVGFAIGYPRQGSFSIDSRPLDIPVGTWIHFAVHRRGDRFRIFMDGDVIRSKTASERPVLDLDSPSSLKFGHRGSARDTPGSISRQRFFLTGQIDEVKLILGRALSSGEIRAIVEAGASGRPC